LVYSLLGLFASSSLVARRFKTTNMQQNIVTGGTSRTSTPMLRFLMKLAFDPAKDARHIAHWAKAVGSRAKTNSATIAINTTYFSARI
jgi:hypothetical protein